MKQRKLVSELKFFMDHYEGTKANLAHAIIEFIALQVFFDNEMRIDAKPETFKALVSLGKRVFKRKN